MKNCRGHSYPTRINKAILATVKREYSRRVLEHIPRRVLVQAVWWLAMVDEEFRDDFPALAEEMSEKRTLTHRIDGVRTMSDEPEEKPKHKTFLPDIVDYIRRCDTVNQAIEIVDWMLNQNEISTSDARAIKSQLKADGLRSFGAKKEKDHYLHHGIEPE
jgi:hypothetical protein